MKIAFTGGGTGGHFYPIIAVAEKVNKIVDEENILGAKLYYISDDPYDNEMLFENGLLYEEVKAGKRRTYFSFLNFIDLFKTFFGVIGATFKLFSIYPDVVFGKGGYASFPALFAARILRIPVMIHESDASPGRVNLWAGKFADKIAVSFKEAAQFFPEDKVAWTGHPIRSELEETASKEDALKYFKFESTLPTLLILGGSQGAELINNTIIDALPRLVKNYQVIHQTGIRNYKIVKEEANIVLGDMPEKSRYLPIAFMNSLQMKMAAGLADVVVSRAGSALFEISNWGIPCILVPFAKSNADHAKKNAFAYAHAGGCSVIEEANMTANILISELENIWGDKESYARMKKAALEFNHKDSAHKIAKVLVNMALSHEK